MSARFSSDHDMAVQGLASLRLRREQAGQPVYYIRAVMEACVCECDAYPWAHQAFMGRCLRPRVDPPNWWDET